MAIAQSKVTAQGQISVPADIRRKLGIGPGSVIEWDDESGTVVVRRAAKFSSKQIHHVLFPDKAPKHRTLDQMKQGIAQYVRRRHAVD